MLDMGTACSFSFPFLNVNPTRLNKECFICLLFVSVEQWVDSRAFFPP